MELFIQPSSWFLILSFFCLLSATLFQHRAIQQARSDNQQLRNILQKKNGSQLGQSSEVSLIDHYLGHSPFPLLIVNKEGVVDWHNPAFRALFGSNRVSSTIPAFDHLFNTRLQSIIEAAFHRSGLTAQEILLKATPNSDDWHRYTALIWPTTPKGTSSHVVISLHEQTGVTQRKLQQIHFEAMLVQLIRGIDQEVQHFFQQPSTLREEKTSPLWQESLLHLQEISHLADYLNRSHTPMRRLTTAHAFDLVSMIREVLKEYQASLTNKQIQTILFLPRSLKAYAHAEDIHTALSSLSEVVVRLCHKGHQLRIHLSRSRGTVCLEIHLPDTVLSQKELDDLTDIQHTPEVTDFMAVSGWKGLQKLQLAVGREIVRKHRGNVEIASNEADGTVLRLSLPATPSAHM